MSLALYGGEAVFRIEDDGPGIPDGEIDAMLQPFTPRRRVPAIAKPAAPGWA